MSESSPTPLLLDTLIVGGGQAGIPLARALAQSGRAVALAERKTLGGSCVNFGCTPTKVVLASARVAHLARQAGRWGIKVGEVRPDLGAVLERARRIVAESVQGLEKTFAENPLLLRGHARLEGRTEQGFGVRVGETLYRARRVVLNTGTRSAFPAGLDPQALNPITAENWLERDLLPDHLLVLGGGYIGLEMAQFYRRMGARVTLVHGAARLLEREDPEVGTALKALLEGEGIEVHLSSKMVSTQRSESGVTLELEDGTALHGSELLVATGRTLNTDMLGLESVGLKPGEPLEVNETLETPVPGLYAAGDIRGGLQLTSTAYDDFRVLRSKLIGDGSKTTRRTVPYAIYTDPPLARVGLSETQAREQGVAHRCTELRLTHLGRAIEDGETEGFMRLIVSPDSGLLLGATLFAPHAEELIHTVLAMMEGQTPAAWLEAAVLAHPSYTEGLQKALTLLEG